MSDLAQTERQTYEDIFDSIPAYSEHSPGENFLPQFLDMAGIDGEHWRYSVLDAGCGTGKGAIALKNAGFRVKACDLTYKGLVPGFTSHDIPFNEACLWSPIAPQIGHTDVGGRFDYVYCCDVIEHIPPEYVMLAIRNLLDVSRRGVFLSIGLQHDTFGIWLGKQFHQTVRPHAWWRSNLASISRLRECRDLLVCGLYMLEPDGAK